MSAGGVVFGFDGRGLLITTSRLTSFAVAGVAAGAPLPIVAAVFGHAPLTTAAIYTTSIGPEARELVGRVWT